MGPRMQPIRFPNTWGLEFCLLLVGVDERWTLGSCHAVHTTCDMPSHEPSRQAICPNLRDKVQASNDVFSFSQQ
jgi:hypothetical protein